MYPTVQQLRQVLQSLTGFTFTESVGKGYWFALVESVDSLLYAHITVSGYEGSDDKPVSFYFERAWPELALWITKKLSELCGTFVIMMNGDNPAYMTPQTNLKEALVTLQGKEYNAFEGINFNEKVVF